MLESIYLHNGDAVNINDLKLTQSFSFYRKHFDAYFDISSSDLFQSEINALKREFLLAHFADELDRKFLLTHDANVRLGMNLIFPEEITKSAVHIVRNPLSIVGSFANYMRISIDDSIDHLNGDYYKNRFGINPSTTLVRRDNYDWSKYVNSWVNNGKYPVHLVRYEDLIEEPVRAVNQLFDFWDEKIESDILLKVVKNCSFQKLAENEQSYGFNETPPTSKRFFRKGSVDSWKEELSPSQILKVIEHHEEIMDQLGYLP